MAIRAESISIPHRAFNFYTILALIARRPLPAPVSTVDSFLRKALYGLLRSWKIFVRSTTKIWKWRGIVVNQFQSRASLPQQDARRN